MSVQYRNQKLRHLFRVFDVDADGILMNGEFIGFVNRLAEAIGHTAPERLERARAGQQFLWELMAAGPGHPARAELGLDQFLAWSQALIRDVEAGGGAGLASWSDAQFELMDIRAAGKIGIAEYAAWCQAYDLPGDPDRMFRQLDEDRDGAISKPQFLGLALEFMASKDPDAAGNVLWGQV